jgi:hypothetical protein
LLVLGILGISRLIVEYVTVFSGPDAHPEPVYYVVLPIDVVLALLLGLSGWGILQERAGSTGVASSALLAGLVNCLGLLAGVFIPAMMKPGLGLLVVVFLAPRFLYYLLFLISAPLMLRFLLIQPPGLSSRKWSLAGSAAISGLMVALILFIRRGK